LLDPRPLDPPAPRAPPLAAACHRRRAVI